MPVLVPSEIPSRFWNVPYDGGRYPGAAGVTTLNGGANCQLFAYELLRAFGREVPPLRSSDLWADREFTTEVEGPFEPLDLLLFNRNSDSYGAHIAVALGDDRAIHLSQRVGKAVVWPLARFHDEADYAILIGAKRVIGNALP
jgi:cell wall-associated NlpC family hydrolase